MSSLILLTKLYSFYYLVYLNRIADLILIYIYLTYVPKVLSAVLMIYRSFDTFRNGIIWSRTILLYYIMWIIWPPKRREKEIRRVLRRSVSGLPYSVFKVFENLCAMDIQANCFLK